MFWLELEVVILRGEISSKDDIEKYYEVDEVFRKTNCHCLTLFFRTIRNIEF